MPHCPEPCSCPESDALREILEGLVVYNEETDPCDDDCECGFCEGRRLLDGLKKKRDEYGARAPAAPIKLKFTWTTIHHNPTDVRPTISIGNGPQPKQGEFKWE